MERGRPLRCDEWMDVRPRALQHPRQASGRGGILVHRSPAGRAGPGRAGRAHPPARAALRSSLGRENVRLMSASTTSTPDALLVRALGVRELAATIFNYTVGSGIFALPAVAVAHLGGAAPLAYLACAIVMTCVALCFAEAGSRVARTGGPYAYVEVALGPFIGFVAGMLLTVTGLTSGAAVAVSFAQTLASLAGAG